MALQSSGPISIDNIRTELGQGQANSSLRSLSALAGKSTPDAISEFYGYSAISFEPVTLGGAPFQEAQEACDVGVDWGTNVFYKKLDGSGIVGAQLYYTESTDFPMDVEPAFWYFVDWGGVFYVSGGIVSDEFYDCGKK